MRRNRKNLYGILIIFLLGLGLGYAALTTNLSINGTAHVDNATWNVYWDNVQVTSGSVTAPTPTISNQTTVSYEITLHQPGDFFEFTVDAVNAGTIDAMIESATSKLNNSPITSLPGYIYYYVSYDNDVRIFPKQYLKANTTEKIKVRVEFRNDINQEDLPGTAQNLSFSLGISYVQADSTAQIRSQYISHSGCFEADGPVISNTEPSGENTFLITENGNGTEQGRIIKVRIRYDAPFFTLLGERTPEAIARNRRVIKSNCPPEKFSIDGSGGYKCSIGGGDFLLLRSNGEISIHEQVTVDSTGTSSFNIGPNMSCF